jgi:hypothetical protein
MKKFKVQKYFILILLGLLINYTWDMFVAGGLTSCGLMVRFSGLFCLGTAVIDTLFFVFLFVLWEYLNNFGIRNLKKAFRNGYFLSAVLVIVLIRGFYVFPNLGGELLLDSSMLSIIYFVLSIIQFSILSVFTFGLVKKIDIKYFQEQEK